MASPFKVFRKNQKKMLAVLTIVTVFSFTFGFIVLQLIEGSGGSASKNAAFTSKYGDISERQLSMLRERHNKIISVLSSILTNMGAPPQQAQQYVQNLFGGSSNEEIANSWLLARRAEELGMVVDENTINDFLKRFTENKITAEQFSAAFKNAGLSAQMFFELMHDELLTSKMKQSFSPSFQVVTPGQRWDYYCRVFKKASVEAVPLPVANYLDQIEDPGDEVLEEFFTQYRDKLPSPYSPDPGFKKPQRVALQYFKANMEQFTSPEAISDEEMMEHYEKNKERYNQVFPPLTAEEPAEGTQAEPAKEEGATEKKPVETPPPAEAKTPESIQPKAEPKEESKGAEQPKSSATLGKSPFILASFQQQPEPEEKTVPELPKESATDAEQPKSTEKPAETPTEPKKPAAPTDELPGLSEQPKADEKPVDTKPKIIGTADQLKKLIRREIAMEKIGKMFEKLGDDVDRYRDLKNDYDYGSPAERKGKSSPQKPDYEKLAKENGLAFAETELIDKFQVGETEIGSVLIRGNLNAGYYAFNAMGKLKPEAGSDTLRENIYLFWKTDESKEEMPKFKDEGIREKVLHDWKMIEARKLALDEAKKLADEASEAGKPLAEVFADMSKLKVIAPPTFSWMSLGNVSMSYSSQPLISAVEGVDVAGNEFMRTVFRLNPGEVSSAMNAPQTVVYVIRVTEFTPTYEELWDRFKETDIRLYGSIAQQEWGRMAQAWMTDIREQSSFQWTPEHKKRLTATPEEEEQ